MPKLKRDQLLLCPSTGAAAKSLPMNIRSTWAQFRQLGQGLASDGSTRRPMGISVENWTHFLHNPLSLVSGVCPWKKNIPCISVRKNKHWGDFKESSQYPVNVLADVTQEQPIYLFLVFAMTRCLHSKNQCRNLSEKHPRAHSSEGESSVSQKAKKRYTSK